VNNPENNVQHKIENILNENGFSDFGFIPLKQGQSFNHYQKWIQSNYQGEMNYLEKHLPIKENPQSFYKNIQSVIVLAIDYLTPELEKLRPTTLPIARYAHGTDYHQWIPESLKPTIEKFQQNFPEEEFLCFTDSKPILERDYAHQAGLGWIGKNTLLIHEKKGSYRFIAEILTSLKLLSYQPLIPDRCGTCQKCLEACPTQAFPAPKVLDATKCISYWTIESKTIAPSPLDEKMSFYFGCDICQEVCPWNSKPLKPYVDHLLVQQEAQIEELRWTLKASNKTLQKKFQGTALSRTSAFGHKRNALYFILNKGLQALTKDVEDFLKENQPKELLELAQKTLNALK